MGNSRGLNPIMLIFLPFIIVVWTAFQVIKLCMDLYKEYKAKEMKSNEQINRNRRLNRNV